MNRDFHFREKIAIALLNAPNGLTDRLAHHPWFRVDDETNSALLIASGHSELPTVLDINLPQDAPAKKGARIGFPSEAGLGLVMALKPLHEQFGVLAVQATVLLPVWGTALSSIELLDNVVPGTDEVASKIERELSEMLSSTLRLGIQCLRVPITEGTMMSVSVKLERACDLADLATAWTEFAGHPLRLSAQLPSAHAPPLVYHREAAFPQPRMRDASTLVGQLRPCPVLDYQFVVVAPNPVDHILMLAEALVVSGRVFW